MFFSVSVFFRVSNLTLFFISLLCPTPDVWPTQQLPSNGTSHREAMPQSVHSAASSASASCRRCVRVILLNKKELTISVEVCSIQTLRHLLMFTVNKIVFLRKKYRRSVNRYPIWHICDCERQICNTRTTCQSVKEAGGSGDAFLL